MALTKNMTEGKPFSLLVSFALPLMATNALQLIYNIVDSAVVGNLIGINAFAAVGAAGFFYWLVLDVVLGCCHGFSAVLGRYFGAQDADGLKRAFANMLLISLVLGAVIMAASLLATRPLLIAMQTPEDILDDTALYLYWMFGGLLISFAFNVVGGAFRAVGDSKTPLIALIIAAALNMLLDVLLVLYTPLGVAAVAVATLIAQVVALLIGLFRLRHIKELQPERAHWRPDRKVIQELIRMGFPIGFRNGVTAVGGVFIQYFINGYGVVYIAGIAAAKRIYSLLQIIASAVDGAIATFVAQNYGARRMDRISEGVVCARRIMLISCVAVMALLFVFGRAVLSLLVAGEAQQLEATLDAAVAQLRYMLVLFPTLNILYLYRSALLGIGDSFFPMLSGFMEMALRIAAVLILPRFFGIDGVYFAEVVGWPLVGLTLAVAYYRIYPKRKAELAA